MTTTATDPPLISFTDRIGTTWRPVVTDAVAAKSKRELGVDLHRLVELPPAEFAPAVIQAETFGALAFLSCEHQMQAEAMSPESFGACLAAPAVVAHATVALMLALVQWRPKSKVAEVYGPWLVFAATLNRLSPTFITDSFK